MSKKSLRITVTIHPDGTFIVLVEWISSNPSRDYELATPLCWGNCVSNDIYLQAILVVRCTTGHYSALPWSL